MIGTQFTNLSSFKYFLVWVLSLYLRGLCSYLHSFYACFYLLAASMFLLASCDCHSSINVPVLYFFLSLISVFGLHEKLCLTFEKQNYKCLLESNSVWLWQCQDFFWTELRRISRKFWTESKHNKFLTCQL